VPPTKLETAAINKKLLSEGAIAPWQYCLREGVPLHPEALLTAPPLLKQYCHGSKKTPNLLSEEKWTWETLEALETGAATQTLLPFEAALLFGIKGEDIVRFLDQIGLCSTTSPSGIPAWAQTKPEAFPPQNTSVNTPKYLGPIPEYCPMSPKEERDLVAETQCGDPKKEKLAEEKLIIANLRLVASLARRHQHGLPLEDLISEGTLGLRVAIKKFNPAMGARLSTYAIWWIKHHLRKALNESKIIRIPLHQQHHIKKIQDTILRLTESTGVTPTDQEIAEETGLKPHIVQTLRDLNSPVISLQDSPLPEGEGRSFEETLRDHNPSGLSPFEHLKSKHAKETLHRILENRLNPQEQRVLSLRFGLNEEPPKTLDETGEELQLTRERIRQIQNLALKKLKESLLAHQNMETTLAYPPKSPAQNTGNLSKE